MFTENKDFYPTPRNLIDKMIYSLDLKQVKSILEPSAGNGIIIDVLKERERIYTTMYNKFIFDIDCIEADKNLCYILKGKKYRLVHNDFLTYDTMKEYDVIIMNPPFSNGCKHLLKALQMQARNGGAVVCLLNAETLKNQCNNDRITLVRLLNEYNANIEYIQSAFTDADRKTNVEIAIVKVQLPSTQKQSFILDGLKKAQERKEYQEADNAQLIENDYIKATVNQYKLEVEAGIKLIKEFYALSPYILSEFGKDKEGNAVQTGGSILKLDLSSNHDSYSSKLSVNDYIREVRRKYWKALFDNKDFVGKLTNNLQQEFHKRVGDLKEYDFSLYNIYEIKSEMSKKMVKGVEDTIISLFDELSHKYYWDKETSSNIHYYNGWKTNKCWIINKKVIIPLNTYEWQRYRPTYYKVVEKLQDIEKCFNYLDGGLTEAVDLKDSLKFAEEFGETKNIQLKYFTVSFYKKGTCHIIFNDDELLKKFNIFGSQYKGWLPPSYGKKTYKDMTIEEKETINNFEGEKEYNKVLNNARYYIFSGNNFKMIDDKIA